MEYVGCIIEEREDLWWFDKYVITIKNSLQQMSLIPSTSSLILIYLNVNGCLRGKIIISLLFHNLSGINFFFLKVILGLEFLVLENLK